MVDTYPGEQVDRIPPMQLNRAMPPNYQPPEEVEYKRVCKKRERTTEFLPLEAWRARGFATQLIVENTTPDYIKEHPQLGKLYGVSLDVEDEVFESSIWEGQARIRDPEQYRIAQSETAVPDGATMKTDEEVMQWPSNRKPPIQFVHITCGNQSKPSFEM